MKKLTTIAALTWLMLTPFFSHAQNNTINLQVKESNGQPIPGATISVDKKRVMATDAQGMIAIPNAGSSIITISATGFKSKTIKADTLTQTSIVLEQDVANLDEVVVTGLSTTVKRRNLANAVATIS
jgi:hypothetical protein